MMQPPHNLNPHHIPKSKYDVGGKYWSEIQKLIDQKNSDKINALIKTEDDKKLYYNDLVAILLTFDEKSYSNLKTLIHMNISKDVEFLLISIIPYLFYQYLWSNKYPQDELNTCGPQVDIIAVDLHNRFVLNQNQDKYSIEKYMKEAQDGPNKQVLSEPIKTQGYKKASYINFDQDHTVIFSNQLELYNRNAIKTVSDSKLYLLGVICFICGYYCEPNDILENKDHISQLRSQKNQGLPGVSIKPKQINILQSSLKTMDDIAYPKRKDQEFVFKIQKSKAYNECRFKSSMYADKIEISMNGLNEFNFF